jgi:hypothetical protein
MLHVTNGDSAAGTIRRSGVEGEVLSWRDVLHDGPVPAGVTDAELREVRARFLADRGWAAYGDALQDFEARDGRLARALEGGEPVVLWFEHDLYDQLQLLQLLDRLAEEGAGGGVEMICIGEFPGVERFLGLGQLTPEQMGSLWERREPVRGGQLELGRRAWAAFRSPDPTSLEGLLREDTAALPFLAAALRRHLEEFPATGSGLSRTEHQVVECLASGVRSPLKLFRAMQDMEEAPHLGDDSFWWILEGLRSGPRPLLRTDDGAPVGDPSDRDARERVLSLTDDGHRVRRAEADWIALRGGIDRWLGGAHLRGPEPRWRWDAEAGRLRAAG